jgi:uncharacterized protein (TIGR03437 family)
MCTADRIKWALMAHLTRIGKRLAGPFVPLALFASLAYSQTPLLCTASAVPRQVRAEGIAERVGDVLLNCSGGTPGATVTANLTLFLSVNVTNKLANNVTDVQLTVDTGAGPVAANVSGQPYGPNAVVFNGVSFTVPATGKVVLRIANLRGDANQLSAPPQPITAFLSFNLQSGLALANSQFTVAVAQPGLLTQSSSSAVRCTGSPLPSNIALANLFASHTSFFSTRVTEGFASAFEAKDTLSDTGVRIMVRYSGFPAGARLFVPDFVAGSSAVQPTAGGDLGVTASGGQYAPSATGSLLMIRVSGADETGAGGTLAFPIPGPGTTAFTSVSEVTLANGAGNVVYEVVDSNPSVRESAQFPTFVGLAPAGGGNSIMANSQVSFAPLSTVNVASTAPIPRFADVTPQSDCAALGDCNAAYFPHLFVDSPPLDFTSSAGAGIQIKDVRVVNNGGGLLNWTATVTYQSGSGWLTATPPSDATGATLFVTVDPNNIPPGAYQATITVDAGPLAGTKTLPVTLNVTHGPMVSAVVNAASFQTGPVVAGSLATITGSGLAGSSVAVTFDSVPAKQLYSSGTQINLQVPVAVAGMSQARMMVVVDGQTAAQTVALALVAPAIFPRGILNRDNTVNSASNPAVPGSAIQIFATGLASPGSGAITARIAGRDILAPNYGGAAPGIPGVQQVNIVIPADLPAGATQVEVCALAADPNQRICSPPAPVVLK